MYKHYEVSWNNYYNEIINPAVLSHSSQCFAMIIFISVFCHHFVLVLSDMTFVNFYSKFHEVIPRHGSLLISVYN